MLCKNVRASKCGPSNVVLSSFQQHEDLALKSPRIDVTKELDLAVLLKSSPVGNTNIYNILYNFVGKRCK